MAERFLTREHVRWSDVDKAGIIFYGAYLRFFEIAETELFRSVGLGYSRMFDEFDIWLPRRQLHFEFHAPALLDDLLDVEGWVGHVGRTSLRLDFATYKMEGDRRVLTADGHVVMVSTDRERLRPVPLPPGLVERLARYYEPAGE
jgi:YbgC/YbaW family acyl-CoA thioester hydrolase